MYNDLFSIGPVTVHTYGLMIAVGVVAALVMGERRAVHRGMNGDVLYPMTLLAVVIGFALGSKGLFCILNWREFIAAPGEMLMHGGFVAYGGIIVGALTVLIFCKVKRLSFVAYADLMLPSVAIAQAFGRIGCFFAGCCYGKPTDAWWGVTFPDTCMYAPRGIPLIPTQLISSLGMFLITGILLLYAARPHKPGQVSALYMMLYSVARFGVEYLRGDDRGAFIGPFSPSQFVSFFILAGGIAIYVVAMKRATVSVGDDSLTDSVSQHNMKLHDDGLTDPVSQQPDTALEAPDE